MGKRRINGEGSVFQRKDGRWVYEFSYSKNGIMKKKILYGRKQSDVVNKKKEFLETITIEFSPAKPYTVKSWIHKWLYDYKRIKLRPGTMDDYQRLMNLYVLPELGDIPLKELTTDMIQHLFNKLIVKGSLKKKDTGISPRTLQYIHSVLKGALKKAVQLKYVNENVALYVELPEMDKKVVKPLSLEEERKLIKVMTDDRLEYAILIALGCGLRIGEICALSWKCVDLEKAIIKVRKTVDRLENPEYPITRGKKTLLYFGKPKTQNSIRDVPIPSLILKKLKTLKDKQEKELKFLKFTNFE